MNIKNEPPLIAKDGVNPSIVWLPRGNWSTLLAFLTERFSNVDGSIWLDRIAKNEVVDESGVPISAHDHYRAGKCLFYYREIVNEQPIPFQENVIFEDEHLVVADKPHFLPVIPSGHYLQETLLTRLRKKLNNRELIPIHRLDRETAGVILLSKKRSSRGLYQQLFAKRAVQKTYFALAPLRLDLTYPLVHTSRMIEAEQFFIMKEVAGQANTETRIQLIRQVGRFGLYLLEPLTGKKHQLRLHMASLGMPIWNDTLYPNAQEIQEADYTKPLKLLAKRIQFVDPITQENREFESGLTLE